MAIKIERVSEELKALRAKDETDKARLTSADDDPIVLLIYALINRGSVLPVTMRQVIQQIKDGDVKTHIAWQLEQAKSFVRQLEQE